MTAKVIGYTEKGRPVFLIAGADGDDDDDAAKVLQEIADMAEELGITPAQMKGRLEASRKWEDRAKKAPDSDELKKLRADSARLKELEDEQKSETQKSADKVAAAEKDAAASKSEALRLRVAMRKGLTETQAKRLVGDSEEDLEKDADDLLASFKPSTDTGDDDDTKGGGDDKDDDTKGGDDEKSTKPGGGRPKEKLRPGATPDTGEEITDYKEHAAKLPKY